jgi:hypothetical protein
MASIEVIMSEREPGMVQLFATGCDASVAALAGIVQAAVAADGIRAPAAGPAGREARRGRRVTSNALRI